VMRLEELSAGQRVNGITGAVVEVVAAKWIGGDFLEVTYRDAAGGTDAAYLDRAAEADLHVDTGDDGEFSAEAAEWKLGVEALRIKHAALIDPMLAVSSSALQPLPHQITAVYGELLPRTPLRYLLADDPGAGKTIMCGLYVKELVLRGELERCLIVAPGSLADQWRDELWEKFGLKFSVLSREALRSAVAGTYFDDNPLVIARMDMLKRDEDLQEDLDAIDWDLVVVDEAHRMSAKWGRDGLDRTKRYALGQLLGRRARNFLLMTATPHSGDAEAFQVFLALLDEDRFGGKPTGATLSPGKDVMRRMLKEDLLTMEGRPLFPPRKAYTVRYRLSPLEQELYDEVGEYVRQGMLSVDRIREGDKRRATNLGFALIVLQRRLASSPEAIWRSLQRRRTKLGGLRDELAARGEAFWDQANRLTDPRADDLGAEATAEEEAYADEAVERISAAETLGELDAELSQLDRLIPLAHRVRTSGADQKWLELRGILESTSMTRDARGRPRKIIVFTEHKDTLNYLRERIVALPGRADSVVEIHGGMDMHERRKVQQRFTQDQHTTVLLATDAAGEGLNLQVAHLMVNYDLPWNPNRIEQRFGRIHRIGQRETCHMWSLVAEDTREGAVFIRLLEKMEEQVAALGAKVYDVLGETFDGEPLDGLLTRAIREGEGARRHLETVIDARVAEELPKLLDQRALYKDELLPVDLDAARHRADLGQRTRLQPYLAAAWFAESMSVLGGRMQLRSDGEAEVLRVPESVRDRARTGTVLKERYGSARFVPEPEDGSGAGRPALGPGHPLFDALTDTTADRYAGSATPGTILVDPTGRDSRVRLLAAVGHDIFDGSPSPEMLSRRFEIVEIDESG
jgi:superfamily II DNA or RNA helicase